MKLIFQICLFLYNQNTKAKINEFTTNKTKFEAGCNHQLIHWFITCLEKILMFDKIF